jgi:UPF0716 protein FxsA
VPLLLILLFIVVPIAELYVIIQVGQEIGVLWTIALLIADSVLGSMLMRSQGRAAWRRFNAAIAEGRVPAREVLDGVLVIFGGALLLTPGFITDVFGLIFLLPPTRAIVRRLLTRSALGRFRFVVAAPGSAARFRRRPADPDPDYDVEGTAREVDPRHLP